VAQDWLEAVRDGDAAAVRALMALPFTIHGFGLEPVRGGAVRRQDGQRNSRGLRAAAATDERRARSTATPRQDAARYVPKDTIGAGRRGRATCLARSAS
jgi:hypothetical protein